MRKIFYPALGSLTLLAALAAGGTVSAQTENAHAVPLDQMAGRLAALIQPGKWSGTSQEFDKTGKPKGPPETDAPACLTKEQVTENFSAIFDALSTMTEVPGCKLTNSAIQAGTASAKIQCNIEGKQLTMTFDGQFEADTFAFTMKNETNDAEFEKSGSMKATAKRTGDC
jgi:Protein of unknown function (DUF3617)